jgi:hypothetical protein
MIAPGLRVKLHVPVAGKPLRTTLPVPTAHVRLVIVPMIGAAGMAFTEKVYVATPGRQSPPTGLFVVRVINTVLPPSAAAGVYIN